MGIQRIALLLAAGILMLTGCSNAANVPQGKITDNKAANVPTKSITDNNNTAKVPPQTIAEQNGADPQPMNPMTAPVEVENELDAPSEVIAKVTEEMDSLIALIRDKQTEQLLHKVIALNADYGPQRHNIELVDMERVLAGLAFEIDIDSIQARLENVSQSDDESYTFEFTMHGTRNGEPVELMGNEEQLNMIYSESDSKVTCIWSYFSYFPNADGLIKGYVDSIKAKDAAKVASVMTVDDLFYTEEKAKKIIGIYDLFFDDLQSLRIKYNGNWTYSIRDSNNNIHMISVIYGDGLIGIEDEFAPEA